MSPKVTAVVVCSTLIDAALAGWILFRGRERIELTRVLLAAVALCASMSVKFVFARTFGATGFLAISFAYVNTFVLTPIAGAALLVAARRRELSKSVRALAWASFAVVPVGIYASFVEPYTLRTERASVPLSTAREGRTPIVIAVLSDIQCLEVTDRERDAVRRAMDAHPDLVLLPGDLVQVGTQRLAEIRDDFRALLAPLAAPLGVYFVQGNCETKEDARYLLEGTPVKILDNEIVDVSANDRRVRVCGVDVAFASRRARDVLRAIETDAGDGDVRIVVAHRPDVIDALERSSRSSRIDLVVAGHTHGGQVQIPFFGPPITLSDVPRAIAAGGLHEIGGTRIYVSRGIGWEHGQAPRMRFLCPPEVSLVTLGG